MTIAAMRLTREMSNRKNQVFCYIRDYFIACGAGPSLREIAEACQTNRARVQDAIRKLEREGRVQREPGKKGGTTPILHNDEFVLRALEARGYIINPPGSPLLDLDEAGRLTVQPSVTKTSLPPPCPPGHDGAIAGTGATDFGTEKGHEARQ